MWNQRIAPLWGAAVLVSFLSPAFTTADAEEILRLDQPDLYELQAAGFELSRGAKVKIDAIGLRPRHQDRMLVYAWILDTETREPVWAMDRERTRRVSGKRGQRRAEDSVDLDAGKYELYLFSGESWRGTVHVASGWDRWVGGWRGDDDWLDYEEELDECYVSLSSDDVGASDLRRFDVTGGMEDAILRFTKLGDSEMIRQGIELEKDMALKLYALVEYPRGDRGPADNLWIVEEGSHEVVWRAGRRNTERAGGGSKNRLVNREVELPKGRYVLYYGTDDSHSYEEFNVNPPYDPMNWGVTVRPGPGFDRSAFKTFEATRRGDPVFEITGLGDYEFHEQAFRLKKDGDLHLFALGEYGYGDREFVDGAWIVNAKTGRTEWEMTRRNTIAAGGADKNRMFDGGVTLEAGEYILYYQTDDSHSYEEWNSATPFEPDAWGVTVYPGEGLTKSDFELVDRAEVEEGGDVLARIVRVGDHERVRERFTLDADTRVHVYALGEGTGGDMYDYGYIIHDDSGRVIWEMRYRRTRHAGGARKNRKFDGEIDLDAGTYEVVYVTDGSHSFEDWNARRPRDPLNWGITVRKAE